MTTELAVDLARDLLRLCLILCGPLLAVSFVVGLITSLLQAATQVQEGSLSFVPKILAVTVAIAAALPWIISRLAEYTSQVITTIPLRL